MDAGVPVKSPVAGVAMGLIKEGDDFAVLTDILGDEDHLGDMDFKVAGTVDGINALQMDIKIDGITREIMEVALGQAKDGRLHILEEMSKAIKAPREQMSEHAPRIVSFKINPDKIRDVIGKGGATIRSITEETGATVDISDDGTVKIFSVDKSAGDEARKRVELITADVEVGMIYEGRVARLMDFGAFVTILPGKDGLVHISQICDERVEKVSDKLSEGDVIKVKVLEVDKQGRIRLSMKAVAEREPKPDRLLIVDCKGALVAPFLLACGFGFGATGRPYFCADGFGLASMRAAARIRIKVAASAASERKRYQAILCVFSG